jgi:hypothetical protein
MRVALLPFLAILACSGNKSSDETAIEECVQNANENTAFVGLFNADSPWTSIGNGYCDEIFVCADTVAAQTLSDELGAQCQAHQGLGYCNLDGEVQCILATEVLVSEQNLTDACVALTVPGIDEVTCAKY